MITLVQRMLLPVLLLAGLLTLAVYLVWLLDKQPPWMQQTLMIMIDPALPLSLELRDTALKKTINDNSD